MGDTAGFWVAFVGTVLFLVAALATGLRRRRRLHLLAGPGTIALLTVAVLLTEELVRCYRFPPGPMRVHLTLAITAGVLAVLVAVSGAVLVKLPRVRRLHRWLVFAFVAFTLCATGTGIWVFQIAELR